jgi:hypothetical protein
LVYALQFSSTALAYAATPSDRLDYNPEAAFVPEVLQVVRKRQWEEMELRAKYTLRAKYCYNFGLMAFLSGLGLILVPHQAWPWPWGRLIGVSVIGVSLVIEAMWTLFDGQRPKFLLPTAFSKTPDGLPDEGAKYIFTPDGPDDIAIYIRRCAELLEEIAHTNSKQKTSMLMGKPADKSVHG